MADIPITMEAGTSKKLLTAGKYCDKDILVTATGGGGDDAVLNSLIDRSITEITCNADNIGMYAFTGCAVMATAKLTKAGKISGAAFYNCVKLEKIDMYCVLSIEPAFGGCSKLKTVIIRSKEVCTLEGSNVFDSTPYIYVPRELVEQYKTATNWVTYADQIRAIEDYPEITGGAQG